MADDIGPVRRRIACLSTEVVETIYLLGAEEMIAGVSGYCVYPPQVRREKPRISGFSGANIEKIVAIAPDLVIAYSDIQAEIVRELVRRGFEVHVFNQRDLRGIFSMIETLGALLDRRERAAALIAELEAQLRGVERGSRPRVYFEEWGEPLICGVRWVSELIALAGGVDVFADRARAGSARERIIADPAEVIARSPDVIIGSWCGRKFRAHEVRARPGWAAIPAVARGAIYEIKSADILSPGPGAITRGLIRLREVIGRA